MVAACSAREEPTLAPDAAREQVSENGLDADTPEASVSAAADAGRAQADGGTQMVADAQVSPTDAAEEAGPLDQQCPGTAPRQLPPQVRRCRTAADCTYAERCGPNYESPGCGACRRVQHDCQDGGCPPSQVCVERLLPCACTAEPSTLCEPRCSSLSCAADEQCGAQGKCEPRSCLQGYACPPQQVCAPGRALADAHGCAVGNCDADRAGCPEGFRCEPARAAPDSSGCVPVSCLDGFVCAPNRVCSAASSELHSCAPKPCTRDEDCGCGVCIAGNCRDELFVCSPPPAP
jgi:hypothetical protein